MRTSFSEVIFTRVKRLAGLLSVLLALTWIPSSGQDEALSNPPDAPTRTLEQEGMTCTIEGVQVIKKEAEKGAKDVSIVFLLTKKPSVYFHYYDDRKKAIVFDFYDTRIGQSILDTIREPPITTSTMELFQIDLNKEVTGLKPDIRDVVRVSLYTPRELEYDVQEDESVITLTLKLNGRKETSGKSENHGFFWMLWKKFF